MPTFGWVFEDAVDRWTESTWRSRTTVPVPTPPPARTPTWTCHLPWCGREFPAEDALDQHIFSDHRHVDLLVRIGQRVYTDHRIIVDDPAPVQVIATGLDGISVSYALPPAWRDMSLTVRADGRRRVAELPAEFVAGFPPRLRIDARWGSTEKKFDIYFDAPVELEEGVALEIDQQLAVLQNEVLEGTPDWNTASRALDRYPALERRYGEGLYEYLLAHFLVADGTPPQSLRDGYRHFERTTWLLSPFTRPLARMASDLAALRLGWYPRLERSRVRRLATAAAFFRVPPSPPTSFPAEQATSAALALDNFHHGVLDAIDCFWLGKFSEAGELLDRLDSGARMPTDRSRAEKLNLLRARVAKAMGDQIRARAHYDQLLDSLYFKREAEAFV